MDYMKKLYFFKKKKSTNRQHQYCVHDSTPSLIQIKLKNVQCVSDYYKYINDATFYRLKFIVFIKNCKVLKSSLVLILRNFIISTFKKGVYSYKISPTWLSLFNNNIQFLPKKIQRNGKDNRKMTYLREKEVGMREMMSC